MEWKPATVEQVKRIVQDDLYTCDEEQLAAFSKNRVEPHSAPIFRYGKRETVLVVAENGKEVIYWEDAEEGFNVSPVASDGTILEHWCNQDRFGKCARRLDSGTGTA